MTIRMLAAFNAEPASASHSFLRISKQYTARQPQSCRRETTSSGAKNQPNTALCGYKHTLTSLFLCGNYNFHDRTRIGVGQTKFATEFLNALSHASDTNPDSSWTQFNDFLFQSFAIVANLYRYVISVPG